MFTSFVSMGDVSWTKLSSDRTEYGHKNWRGVIKLWNFNIHPTTKNQVNVLKMIYLIKKIRYPRLSCVRHQHQQQKTKKDPSHSSDEEDSYFDEDAVIELATPTVGNAGQHPVSNGGTLSIRQSGSKPVHIYKQQFATFKPNHYMIEWFFNAFL